MRESLLAATLAVVSAAAQTQPARRPPIEIAGQPVELAIAPVSARTLRVTFRPIDERGVPAQVSDDPVLVAREWPAPSLRLRTIPAEAVSARAGEFTLSVTLAPISIRVRHRSAEQAVDVDAATGAVSTALSGKPVFGLGQGGPQFDRTGIVDPMNNHANAYRLAVFGGRMPVPWIIDSGGWAMFIHQPKITADLTGGRARFAPTDPKRPPLPLDLFLTIAGEPAVFMNEYTRLTGFPSLPPLWALGYQQSHRTIMSRDEVQSIARNLREKKLPCDVLIYLGTGWCPSGWNTGHASFTFNPPVFPDPPNDIRALKQMNFRVILHAVFPPFRLFGRAGDAPESVPDEASVASYWAQHLPVFRLGVDGWWPDASENLSDASRLARIRMYWEGPRIERPNARPYALHRTGYAGMQRYGGWLWSGDVNCAWETLRAQVPVGINTSLSGVPYWGTDIGGFFSTKELTGELYTRWFQFGAFCPLFRAHGRPSHTRFPWGWNTGELGPPETDNPANLPDLAELRNPRVEPICRKYLELRYRLMPYLYSIARESHDAGMPIMRALWLHYPDDPRAVERGDEYLWGRDMLVAPVTEKGAASRTLYLPAGTWYDFWTHEKVEGGRELTRSVDLETMPLYVRAGAVIPMAPLKQYTAERPDSPLTIAIYPGADGRFVLYEDDGVSFDHEKGSFMRLRCEWNDRARRLTIALEPGSKVLPPAPRPVEVRVFPEDKVRRLSFDGKPVTATL